MFLQVKIVYKTNGLDRRTSELIVAKPSANYQATELFDFFWMLSQSNLVAEFVVSENGRSIMPSHFGWACDKWVEEITYSTDYKE